MRTAMVFRTMLKHLKAIKGTIDLEKFKSGKYVILQESVCTDNAEKGDSFYEPGDKLVLQTPTSRTEQKIEYDENGEALGSGLTNLEQKEYEVMAIVEALPGSMNPPCVFPQCHYHHSSAGRNEEVPQSRHVCKILYRGVRECRSF